MMKRILLPLLLMASFGASGESLSGLRGLCPKGQESVINAPYMVEGVVVSDYRSPNMELNPNVNFARVDDSVNDATAYIQQADGLFGVRVVFDEAGENRLRRYDRVSLNLQGCRIERDALTGAVTLRGFSRRNVLSCEEGTAEGVPVKERTLSSLGDADIYTFVTLMNMEFIFRSGGYTDIAEQYSLPNPAIHKGRFSASGRMDGWACLMRDHRGNTIYMLVNSLCDWRRTGTPLPAGNGSVSGIIVHTPMRRYGGDMGRYSIRPVDANDIAISKKSKSGWKRLTGWILDGKRGRTLDFELLGRQELPGKKTFRDDRIMSDTGRQAWFWTDTHSDIGIDYDFDAATAEDKGRTADGAILFKAPTTAWYNFDGSGKAASCNSFLFEFSTEKISSPAISFSFSWSAGDFDINHSTGFPLYWKVQCSCDDGKWVTLKEAATGAYKFTLRSLPWWDGRIKNLNNGHYYRTGYDTGLGNQQRSFLLPAEAAGCKKVVVRISPASGELSRIRKAPATDMAEGGRISPDNKDVTYIRFGAVSVDYRN